MSTVPIVQGVSVTEPHYQQAPSSADAGGPWNKQQQPDPYAATAADGSGLLGGGGPQNDNGNPRQFQDVFWGILFVGHLVAVIVLIFIGLQDVSDVTSGSYGNILFMVSVSALCAVGLSTFALSFMMRNAEVLVQMALIFSVLSSLAIGIAGFVFGSTMMGIIGIASFVIGCCYAKLVWHRIPFAAANLKTGLAAVRANLGLAAIAYAFTAIAFVWTLAWFLGLGSNLSQSQLGVVFLLFVSYYWVHQVLQNTVHVTTAGVVGTWWFVPDEASSCCSRALGDSFFRATTYSFGSICFGSLLVAIIQALRALEHYTRDNEDLSFVRCIVQCLLRYALVRFCYFAATVVVTLRVFGV